MSDMYPDAAVDAMLTPPLVYVAGPFSAPNRVGVEVNIGRATQAGLDLARLGVYPVIPHANTAHPEFETVQAYRFWILGTLEQMRRCDAVFLLSAWNESRGARAEREEAERVGLPVFASLAAVKEWLACR